MSEKLLRWAKANADRRNDQAQEDALPAQEARALKKLQQEAKAAGSDLASQGKGGLAPSLVLGVMRRDEWKCKRCGELGDMETNGGLSVHHQSEHLNSPKAKARSALLGKEGRINTRSNVVSLCARCHDAVHQDDRDKFGGEKKE